MQENWKSIKSYHIDESSNLISVIHDNYCVKYDFNGTIKNEDDFFKQKLNFTDYSPYQLKDEALQYINKMIENGLDEALLNKVTKLLNASESNSKMSSYQLSLAYQQLGDLYFKNSNHQNALNCYQHGLELNPKLSVKRIIKSLQDD